MGVKGALRELRVLTNHSPLLELGATKEGEDPLDVEENDLEDSTQSIVDHFCLMITWRFQ